MKGDVTMLDVNAMKEVLNYALEQVKAGKGISITVSFYSTGTVNVSIYGREGNDED